MTINEYTISSYTLNRNEMYSVAIVYQIGKKSEELVAHISVNMTARTSRVESLGTTPTGSKAEKSRVATLAKCASLNAQRYATMTKIEGPDNIYRHMDFRK